MAHAAPAAGTESARPFLPARDFEASKAFYEALGFVSELDADDVAIYPTRGLRPSRAHHRRVSRKRNWTGGARRTRTGAGRTCGRLPAPAHRREHR
jgi:hypothetical protein